MKARHYLVPKSADVVLKAIQERQKACDFTFEEATRDVINDLIFDMRIMKTALTGAMLNLHKAKQIRKVK